MLPILAQTRPSMFDLGEILADVARHYFKLGQSWPHLAGVGTRRPDFGQSLPSLVGFGHLWPKSAPLVCAKLCDTGGIGEAGDGEDDELKTLSRCLRALCGKHEHNVIQT